MVVGAGFVRVARPAVREGGLMAIALVGVGTGTAGTGGAPTAPTKHASTAVGDLLVYVFFTRHDTTLTTPAGWDRPVHLIHTGNTVTQLAVYTKIDDGSAVPAIVRAVNTNAWICNVLTFSGRRYDDARRRRGHTEL